jgi:hypothetical protein
LRRGAAENGADGDAAPWLNRGARPDAEQMDAQLHDTV